MRPIKFRAWDKNRKRMLSPAMPSLGGGISWNNGWDALGVEGYDLMQFTGLFDKNGKEIYEGDILKPPQSKPPIPKENNESVTVEWHQPSAGYILVRVGTDSVTHGTWRASNAAVIGNIHENTQR